MRRHLLSTPPDREPTTGPSRDSTEVQHGEPVQAHPSLGDSSRKLEHRRQADSGSKPLQAAQQVSVSSGPAAGLTLGGRDLVNLVSFRDFLKLFVLSAFLLMEFPAE